LRDLFARVASEVGTMKKFTTLDNVIQRETDITIQHRPLCVEVTAVGIEMWLKGLPSSRVLCPFKIAYQRACEIKAGFAPRPRGLP
jgi:hypothetical protein